MMDETSMIVMLPTMNVHQHVLHFVPIQIEMSIPSHS
jgi:hypothetical protein